MLLLAGYSWLSIRLFEKGYYFRLFACELWSLLRISAYFSANCPVFYFPLFDGLPLELAHYFAERETAEIG
jgi:hypothetical protein